MAAHHCIEETTHEGYPALALRAPEEAVEVTYAPGVGMVACSLRHRGEELLGQRGGLARYEATGSTFGIPLLHPWANRLAEREYEVAGSRVAIDAESPLVRSDPNGLPIHGLAAASPHWSVDRAEAGDEAAQLCATLDFGAHPELLEAFPFPHELAVEVRQSGATLAVRTTLTATGDVPVPVSFGYHPYLTLPAVPRADWHVEMPAARRIVPDDRGIPTGASEPFEALSGPLREREFDDGFAEIGESPTYALEGGGRRIEVRFTDGYPYAQVYAPLGQDLICFEPMTAPTNALVSGDGLTLVQPGATYSAGFEIRVS